MQNRVNHKFLFALIFFLIIFTHANALIAGTTILSWSPPAENADGTTLSDLAGYTISYGTETGNYTHSIDVGNVTTYDVQGLTSDMTYYFVVTAYDLNGNESDYSNEGSKYIQDTTTVTYYCDSDTDGSIGSIADGVCTGIGCQPSGCVTTPGNDCNDNNPAINPGATDSNCNGIDENCNGVPDDNHPAISTSCGTGACQSSGLLTCINGSVIDTCITGSPSGDDSNCNGIDENCDGTPDNNFTASSTTCGTGACQSSGQLSCVNGTVADTCIASPPSGDDYDCNGIDNNCNGETDENYEITATECGTGACESTGQLICVNGTVADTCIAGNPSGDDSDCNNIDDDCDGVADNHYVIKISSCGTGECSSIGQIGCNDGSIYNSCFPLTPYEEVEISLEDGLDNDCDGLVDEGRSAKIDIKRVILAEDFSEGIPEFWSTEGSWNTENSCSQVVDQPFAGSYAIADSSCTEDKNNNLVTSPLNTNGCDTAMISFSNQYYWYSGSMEVDISTDGGTTWINYLYTNSDDNYPTPAWKYIDLGTVTESDKTLVNFKYSNESTAGFWAIDNLWVTCKASGLDFSSHINMSSSPESVLISNTGSDTLSIDAIEIEGSDSSDFDPDLEDCLNKSLLPGESCMIDIVFLPGSGGAKNANILITTNDPDSETSMIVLTGTANSALPPVPAIRVNGLDGSANIKRGSQITLTVDLDPKSYIYEDGDWWILMEYKNRWHYYGAQSDKWRRGSSLYQQGPLVSSESVEVLNTSSLHQGVYTFHFGVDTQMNGLQDLSNYYFDSITVNIE